MSDAGLLTTNGRHSTPANGPRRRPLSTGAAVLALIAVLVVAVAPTLVTLALGEAPYDRVFVSYPGVDVAVVTTLLRAGADLAGLITAGAIVHVLFLRDATARQARVLPQGFEMRVLRVSSGVWAVCAGALIVFEMLDANGAPLERLGVPGAFSFLFEASYAPMAWTISFVAATIVFFVSFFADQWTGLLVTLWASALGLLSPVVTSQVLVGPNHDFGGDAAVFQTIAASAFFGAVSVAALRVLSGRFVSPVTLRRLFLLGAFAMPVIVVSDVIITLFELAGTSIRASLTGWLFIARAVCLLAVAAAMLVGWRLARAGRLRARNVTTVLLAGTIATLGWVGAGVAMTRQPPPQYFVPTSIAQVFMGFDTVDAPSILVLFTQWRPNVLFLGISTAAVAVYLWAVRRLRRRGDHWPIGRTVSWLAGWAVVVFVTSSGFGKYSAPDFGIHMIVHMSLNMLAPALLVLGGIVTLLLRAYSTNPGGPANLHDWLSSVLHWPMLRVIYNPLLVFVVFIASYYALYLTPIFGDFMRFHWAHQLMNLHFLVIGYLFYSLVIGVDRPPRPLPHIGKLGYVLAAMPFHAFFGVILMTSSVIIAETYYRYLDMPWANLQGQQYLAGGVAWAGGEIPLMVIIVILAIQWSRQDAREAGRKDRHIDTGRDDEFEAYNDMLQRLAARDGARTAPRPDAQKEPQP